MALKFGLVNEGFTVFTSEDGDDGLAVAIKEKPDLILSDIVMPSMDGITMSKKLKESNIHVPIIFLTNIVDVKHIMAALKANIELDYIVKSDLNISGIVEKVKNKLK
jgi:DNA-binding response OmpR family regulator